jgi:hypothetical protein
VDRALSVVTDRDDADARADAIGVDRYIVGAEGLTGTRIAAPGLMPEVWRDVRGAAIDSAPHALPYGIVSLHWPRDLSLGQPLSIAGRVRTDTAAEVVLTDPFGLVESRAAVSAEAPTFALSVPLRAPGHYLASLELLDADGDRVDGGVVPVVVRANAPLQMRVLASSPSFEIRGLRRWAEQSGASLLLQTQMSRDVVRTDYVNRQPDDDQAIDSFDVMLIDADAWSSAEDGFRVEVVRAVEAGLGLILLAGPSLLEAEGADPRLRAPAVRRRETPRRLSLAHLLDRDDRLPALIANGVALSLDERDVALAVDDAGDAVAAYRAQGRGRVASVVVTGTHRWQTSGFAAVHARFWREIVHAVARPDTSPRLAIPPIVTVDHRVELCVAEGVPSLRIRPLSGSSTRAAAATLTLVADPLGAACTFYWPRRTGWHRAGVDGRGQDFYVFDDAAWPGLRATAAADATQRVAMGSPPSRPTRSQRPLSPALLLTLFVLLAGATWMTERRTPG